MTKTIRYEGKLFKPALLADEIEAVFPEWGGVTSAGTSRFYSNALNGIASWVDVHMPDAADELTVQAVVDAHDHTALSGGEVLTQDVNDAVTGFKALPDYATWTPAQAEQYVVDNVLSGMDKTASDAWIDGNVTNIASAKTAMKQLAGAIIDLRKILSLAVKMLMWLRNIIIRTRS